MFFGSSKSVRCGLPTNRNLLGYAKRQRSRHETSYQYLGVSIGSWLFIAQKLTNAEHFYRLRNNDHRQKEK
jgi:hypothetical protein